MSREDFEDYSADDIGPRAAEDVRALAQAVRLGDRLEAERLLVVIFAPMGLSEAVERGLYNSATARAAGK